MFDTVNPFGRWQEFQLQNFFRGSLLTMGIINNDPDLVRQGLEQGEDPNARYSYEENNDSITMPNPVRMITPIVQAAVIGSLPITRLLVDYGADVNKCQKNGESALADAANNGNIELVSYLLSHGADPNVRKPFGTPLALADGAETMRVLLDHGADPNIPDSDGDLPIIGSIDTNNLDEIELLISYGTDMEHRNNRGETPLDRAKLRGNYKTIKKLMRKAKPKRPERISGNPEVKASAESLPELTNACKSGDFYRALALLKSGADPNERTAGGRTPLFYCKEVALVCLLEQFGANVNATDDDGNTAIINFLRGDNIKSNSERAVVFLIEAGTDIDMKNSAGISARDVARSEIDPDIRAAFSQGLGIVERKHQSYENHLADQRNNLNEWHEYNHPFEPSFDWEKTMTDCFNASVLSDLEFLKANEEFVRTYISVRRSAPNTNTRSMLMMACNDASIEVVEYLISLGADVNQTDNTGQTSLRYAAVSWRDAAEKINLLIENGANVNHRSNDGSAALSDAAYEQNVPAAKALIESGADVNNRDDRDFTALSWSCAKGAPSADIVELLLRSGADVRDLYEMNCALQYLDYENGHPNGMPREYILRPQDLEERYLYEHALIPVQRFEHGGQQLFPQGFNF